MADKRVNAIGLFFAESFEVTHDFAQELSDKYGIELDVAAEVVTRIFRAGAEEYDRFTTNLRNASD